VVLSAIFPQVWSTRSRGNSNPPSSCPFTDGYDVNLNDADPKGKDRNYGQNFARLAELKRQFDPLNLFRLNANIKPGGSVEKHQSEPT
jgi:Berberine and berberine like